MKKVYDEKLQDYVIHASSPAWVVKEVQASENYTLMITFATDEKRIYDALPLLEKPIYAPLKNLSFFMKAKVEGDSVAWSEDIDIAPEHLYECSVPINKTE